MRYFYLQIPGKGYYMWEGLFIDSQFQEKWQVTINTDFSPNTT